MLSFAIVLAIVGQLASANDRAVSRLTSASAEFSQRLYLEIAMKERNVVYSPYSIHSVLTLTSLGAGGLTLVELNRALGINAMEDNVHETYKEIIEQLNNVTDVKILTGNGIFVNPKYAVEAMFMEEASKNYFAKADNINMDADGGPENPINQYVENQTEGLIKNLLPQGSIGDETVMVIVNTLFFNGTWQETFNEDLTDNTFFKQSKGLKTEVQMMHDDRTINIKKDDSNGVDVAELPFKGGRFSLYIALPRKVSGITDLENLIARPGEALEFFKDLQPVYVSLGIPKFKIETSLNLPKALRKVGIINAFDKSRANFDGIYKKGNVQDGFLTNTGQVYISDVVHKAVIEVQETGTVAAAATAVSVELTSVKDPPKESFIANHPFMYFLRDNHTGQILFQGKFSG